MLHSQQWQSQHGNQAVWLFQLYASSVLQRGRTGRIEDWLIRVEFSVNVHTKRGGMASIVLCETGKPGERNGECETQEMAGNPVRLCTTPTSRNAKVHTWCEWTLLRSPAEVTWARRLSAVNDGSHYRMCKATTRARGIIWKAPGKYQESADQRQSEWREAGDADES